MCSPRGEKKIEGLRKVDKNSAHEKCVPFPFLLMLIIKILGVAHPFSKKKGETGKRKREMEGGRGYFLPPHFVSFFVCGIPIRFYVSISYYSILWTFRLSFWAFNLTPFFISKALGGSVFCKLAFKHCIVTVVVFQFFS